MKQNLEKIEDWLKKNAEKIFKYSLQKPATQNEISSLEKIIDKKLPNDFKQLYLWHNGLSDEENFGSLFYGMDFFPIHTIILEYQRRRENYASQNILFTKIDKQINPSSSYNHDWIKFAFDGAHTRLYLDLVPNVEGTYGQIIFLDEEYETAILVAKSTTELVENFKHDLENNLYSLAKDALEDDNHYLESDAKIDLVNWETSEKWKR